MSPPTDLLLVADTLGGGLGAAVLGQARWFAGRGWAVTVAAPAGAADPPPDVTVVEVPLPRTARDVAGAWPAVRRLRALTAAGPAIRHAHGPRAFALTRLAGGPAPYVTLHGTGAAPDDPRGYDWLRRAGLRALPRWSAGAFTAVPGQGGGWRFLPHASPRLAGLAPAGPPAADAPFLWLGRLAEPKQPAIFLRALARAAASVPVRGVIAGTGPLETGTRQLAAQLGAPVSFAGHVDDVGGHLAAARAVVMVSRFEAVTFALQEAMWVGRAALGNDLPGHRWLLGADGVVAGEAALTEALVGLADPAAAARAGAAAAGRVRRLLAPDDPWPAVEAAMRDGSFRANREEDRERAAKISPPWRRGRSRRGRRRA